MSLFTVGETIKTIAFCSAFSKLDSVVHAYCGIQVDLFNFFTHCGFFHTIKFLRTNKDMLITKPDNVSVVVILNSSDYVQKLQSILKKYFQIHNLNSAVNNDNTSRKEAKIQRRQLQINKDKTLSRLMYEAMCTTV